jgi:hypothetical protein
MGPVMETDRMSRLSLFELDSAHVTVPKRQPHGTRCESNMAALRSVLKLSTYKENPRNNMMMANK